MDILQPQKIQLNVSKQQEPSQPPLNHKPKIVVDMSSLMSPGILVELQRQKLRKLKENKIDANIYIPLEESDMIKELPLPSSELFKTKLEAFDRFVQEEKQNEQKHKRRLEREKLESIQEQKYEAPPTKKQFFQTDNLAVLETGVQADGQALFSGAHIGLGYVERPQANDVDRFRRQTHEERAFTSGKSEQCYKCNQLGHIARDCKL